MFLIADPYDPISNHIGCISQLGQDFRLLCNWRLRGGGGSRTRVFTVFQKTSTNINRYKLKYNLCIFQENPQILNLQAVAKQFQVPDLQTVVFWSNTG